MLTYLASSTPLPVGKFITAPDVIYCNYAEYQQSTDFVNIMPEKIFVSPPYDFSIKLHRTNCPVHFYKRKSEVHFIGIDEYKNTEPPTRILPDVGVYATPSNETQELIRRKQDVTTQFSLPYIYYLGMGCSETALRELICLI